MSLTRPYNSNNLPKNLNIKHKPKYNKTTKIYLKNKDVIAAGLVCAVYHPSLVKKCAKKTWKILQDHL